MLSYFTKVVPKVISPQVLKINIVKNITSYSTMSSRQDYIVWIDMEMTGLDYKKDKILEVACLITDKNINIVAEGPALVIHQPPEILNSMNEWCIKHHGQTGLTQDSLNSNIDINKAEDLLLEFLKQNIPQRICPVAGNSVYVDRIFLEEYMPRVNEYLHYRIIDVSSIKELCKRWNPKVYYSAPKKKLVHRGLDDIRESIEELKYYKQFMFTKVF